MGGGSLPIYPDSQLLLHPCIWDCKTQVSSVLIYPKCFARPSQIHSSFPLPSYMTTMNPSRGESYGIYTNLCQIALKRGPAHDIYHKCSGTSWEGRTSQRQERASWVGVTPAGGVTGIGAGEAQLARALPWASETQTWEQQCFWAEEPKTGRGSREWGRLA